jgi:pyridoxal phosphate enzyme (YggS family)
MNDVEHRIRQVHRRLRAAEEAAGRPAGSVSLLAVSKQQDTAAIEAALGAGQAAFGENYLQEALEKISTLAGRSAEWHFIGALQSNKTKAVAENFDWLHSLDSARLARRLSAQRPAGRPPLQVCIQVNVSGENSKSGVTPEQTLSLARDVAAFPNLRLRGLMTLPAPSDDADEQRRPFRLLRELLQALRADGLDVDTLSMGMSADLEAAVLEGATMVRVGTAIFGPRPRRRT